jgi:hypothetical protein
MVHMLDAKALLIQFMYLYPVQKFLIDFQQDFYNSFFEHVQQTGYLPHQKDLYKYIAVTKNFEWILVDPGTKINNAMSKEDIHRYCTQFVYDVSHDITAERKQNIVPYMMYLYNNYQNVSWDNIRYSVIKKLETYVPS